VNLFPSQIEELVLASEGLAPHYQLEITRSAVLDELTVSVEPAQFLAPGVSERERLAAALAARIKALIGLSARVVLCEPGTLERSLGKARRVMDRRPR